MQEAGPDGQNQAQRSQAKDGPNLSGRHLTFLGVTILAVILHILRSLKVDVTVLIVLAGNNILDEAADLFLISLLIIALIRTILGTVQVLVALAGTLIEILAQLINVVTILLVTVDILVRLIRFTARRARRIVVRFQVAAVVLVSHHVVERNLIANVDGAILVRINTDANRGLVRITVRTEVVTVASYLLALKVLRQIVIVVATAVVVVVVIAYVRIRGASIVIRAAVCLVIVSVICVILGIISVVLICGSIFKATATTTFTLTLLSFLPLWSIFKKRVSECRRSPC